MAGHSLPITRRRHRPELLAAALCAALSLVGVLCNAAADESIGRTVTDFTLPGADGAAFRLADHADAPAVVVVFLGTECPLARLYLPRLAQLAKSLRPRGVILVGVDSNLQDAPAELAALADEFDVPFPLLKDADHRVADQFSARRTPEAFVLDGQRAIRYRGRIDDQYGIGYQRPAPQRHDLSEAVLAVLEGRPVAEPVTPAPGCLIGRARPADEASEITWSGQIAGLVQRRCQTCHRTGELAPFSLETYEAAAAWQEMIAEVVRERRMPPWHADPRFGHFQNDARLSDQERELVLAWVERGAPRGAAGEPPPRTFTPGWKIGVPDQVVYMTSEPFSVPAEGTVAYQWFRVDPGFTEDKWVRAAEARPGCAAAVHHVTVYHEPRGVVGDLRLNDRINLLGGYNPGGDPWTLPPGAAMRIPAGSQIVFEMHYTPNGVPHTDRSYIGLSFARPEEVREEVLCIMPANTQFSIPPGAENYAVEARYRFPVDVDLLLMRPHMHLRGQSFQYDVRLPDGGAETLLRVPRYEFDWQHSYVLRQPRRLPAGTELLCTAHFDNSADNRSNPDPAATVRWGDQSWEEMMIGIVMVRPVDRFASEHAHWASAAPGGRWRPLLLAAGVLAALAAGIYGTARSLRPNE